MKSSLLGADFDFEGGSLPILALKEGFSNSIFQISPFRELKKAIAALTHLRLFFALHLQLKNI